MLDRMKANIALVPIAGNLLVSLLAIAWAYTSYKYNLLNVGGGIGDVNFWDSARGVVPILFLTLWAIVLTMVLIIGIAYRQKKLVVFSNMLVTLLLGPLILFTALWLLHRGFPPSPV